MNLLVLLIEIHALFHL